MMTLDDINNHKLVPTPEQKANMEKLALVMTEFELGYGKPLVITSGLRSVELQAKINPSVRRSAHCEGNAVDCLDVESDLWRYCMDNFPLLIRLGLYLEDKTYTKIWVHFQIRLPKSGNRVFIP